MIALIIDHENAGAAPSSEHLNGTINYDKLRFIDFTIATTLNEAFIALSGKIDLIICNSTERDIELLQQLQVKLPVAVIITQQFYEKALRQIELIISLGYKPLFLDQTFEQNIIALVKNHRETAQEKLELELPFVKKSDSIKSILKQLKKLKNAHTISIIGPDGSGKKRLAKYFAQMQKKEYSIIYDGYNFRNNNNLTIIDHPERLSETMQQILLNEINKTIGSKKQWIIIINNDHEDRMIKSLNNRILFKLYLDSPELRQSDTDAIITNLTKHYKKTYKQKYAHCLPEKVDNYNKLHELILHSSQVADLQHKMNINENLLMNLDYKTAIKQFEQMYFKHQLKKSKQKAIAEASKINRSTIYRKLRSI